MCARKIFDSNTYYQVEEEKTGKDVTIVTQEMNPRRLRNGMRTLEKIVMPLIWISKITKEKKFTSYLKSFFKY